MIEARFTVIVTVQSDDIADEIADTIRSVPGDYAPGVVNHVRVIEVDRQEVSA